MNRPALALRQSQAPEGLSSILDRLARCEISKAEAHELFAAYEAVHPRPKQKTIACVGCGQDMNDNGQWNNDLDAARCGACEAERAAEGRRE